MKSLYDALNPDAPSQDQTPAPEAEPLSPKAFCRNILRSQEFRHYLLNGITLGDIPPAVICKIMDHGWGKVPDKVELEDKTLQLEHLSVEDVKARIQKLYTVLEHLRTNDEVPEPSEDDGSVSSVH